MINWHKQFKRLVENARRAYVAYLKFRLVGKNIYIKELIYFHGHNWIVTNIVVKDIIWPDWDTNGPTFIDTLGKKHNSHPEHDILIG